MKMLALSVAIAASQLLALGAQAQTTDDKAAAKAERRKEGAEAAKNPLPAEGINPIPDARRKSSPGDKAAARTERRTEGAEASKNPLPAEGIEDHPAAKPKVSKADRDAARQARRAAAAKANKAGELKPQNF
ncbi:hypothetical protein WKW79_16430 [Variovorax robiniae]|uniref:Cell envelope biogenesis protein TolA n=1 Tax=Variovorax robiniae TaxID=1836199 RepID=A0ABU8X8Q6_9BURK